MLTVDQIKELIQTIDHSSITDFNYEANGVKVSLQKQSELPVVPQRETQVIEQQVPKQQQAPKEIVTKDKAEEKEEPEKEAASSDHDYEITSPMVGTFYAKSSPESDNYVKEGSQVTTSTTVCIVEAMKLFNEIEAEVNGEITEILVTDGELVEYGQPLFRVKQK